MDDLATVFLWFVFVALSCFHYRCAATVAREKGRLQKENDLLRALNTSMAESLDELGEHKRWLAEAGSAMVYP